MRRSHSEVMRQIDHRGAPFTKQRTSQARHVGVPVRLSDVPLAGLDEVGEHLVGTNDCTTPGAIVAPLLSDDSLDGAEDRLNS